MAYRYLVLFSADSKWKIADCGFSLDDSKKHSVTSKAALQAHVEYRAPEMLNNQKDVGTATDIWALGCIVYEMVTQRKAFTRVEDVRDYSVATKPLSVWPYGNHVSKAITLHTRSIELLVCQTLDVSSHKRPSAKQFMGTLDGIVSVSHRRMWKK